MAISNPPEADGLLVLATLEITQEFPTRCVPACRQAGLQPARTCRSVRAGVNR